MALLKFFIKIITIIAVVLVMFSPLLLECNAIKKDKKHKIRHKRLRILLFTIAYVFVVALVLHVLGDFKLSLSQLKFFQWLSRIFAVDGRFIYFTTVYAAIAVNLGIGVLFRVIKAFIRRRLRKKSLVIPADKKHKKFTRRQRFERWLIKKLYNETWFFVSRVVKWFTLFLTIAYALLFVWHQIPALFSAGWLPYSFIVSLFRSSYMYPILSLLILWEFHFFVDGIRCVDKECPELLKDMGEVGAKQTQTDLDVIDKECKRLFASHYMGEVTAEETEKVSNDGYAECVEHIGQAVVRDRRHPKEKKDVYMKCMNSVVNMEESLIINGSFFSEFSMYFLRYLSIILARGDNIVLVCNDEEQIEDVYNYVKEGLSKITSLYAGESGNAANFDTPIWKISKVCGSRRCVGDGEEDVDNSSILVATLDYICSNDFERENERFANLIDTIVFVDVINTINMYPRKMSILNMRLLNITKNNAVLAKSKRNQDFKLRYMSKQVRYLCFDSTRTPGMDKVLKNMLSVDFKSADAMADSAAMIRCYSYEGRKVGEEDPKRLRLLPTDEEVGVVLNMALLCLIKGAKNVTVFVDDEVPYGSMRETIAANEGNLTVLAEGRLRLNDPFYNPDDYSVIIAVDSGNNLPATIRKYASMVGDKKTLIMIFSPKYMLRDYYVENIDALWKGTQIERVPAKSGVADEVAQKIIVKANAGGISEEEIFNLASTVPAYAQYEDEENINAILQEVLSVYCNIPPNFINVYDYFEFVTIKDFDENGRYQTINKVVLRHRGIAFDMLNGRDLAVMVAGEKTFELNVPKCRLTQNYIEGQKFVYNGSIYSVSKIDTEKGKLYAHLADGGNNDEGYKYIQARRYNLDDSTSKIVERVPRKHLVIHDREENKLGITDAFVSIYRAPMEVLTDGYYMVDAITLDPHIGELRYWSISDPGNDKLARQTYRVYGMEEENRTYSGEDILSVADLNSYHNGALTISLKIRGTYNGKKNETASALAVGLHELLRAMFPSVADSIVVCPLVSKEFAEQAKITLSRYPQLSLINRESVGDDEIEIFIIEDSADELGVVSTLMHSGEHIFKTLFTPLLSYMEWYFGSGAQQGYLNLGFDKAPECFDFENMRELLRVFADDRSQCEFIPHKELIESVECNFCGKRYAKGSDMVELEDGRVMCSECARSLVSNNRKTLEDHLKRAKLFLESTYGIELDDDYDFCFESTIKIINALKKNPDLVKRGADFPVKGYIQKGEVYIEEAVSSDLLSEMIVRQLTEIWQNKHLPGLEDELAEGHVALVGIHYLNYLKNTALANVRTRYYETSREISGSGYRRLVRELIANPKYNNNPFLYLIDIYGTGGNYSEQVVIPQEKATYDDADFGKSYTPSSHDRLPPDKVPEYYYSMLTSDLKKVYRNIFDAIVEFYPKASFDTTPIPDVEHVLKCITYDHPELYYLAYCNIMMSTTFVELAYLFTKEETAAMQERMDPEIQQYLACVTDSMSAYDAALRLQTKMVELVDYDDVALETEDKNREGLDYLRTICGIFLNRKAVCAGYAKAMQYLLRRCGIECAYCTGHVIEKNGSLGGGHAWNIFKMDGDYYQLDVTHNDPSKTSQKVRKEGYDHSYFGITTEEISRTRNFDMCPMEPAECTATRCNYFTHNELVLDSYDLDQIKALAKAAAKRGSKYFCFKFSNRSAYGTAEDRVLHHQDFYEILKAAAKADKNIRDDAYSHFDCNDRLYTMTVWFRYK